MEPKTLKKYLVMLGLVITVQVLANIYLICPDSSLIPARVGDSQPVTAPENTLLTYDTLDRIKQLSAAIEPEDEFYDLLIRNPFLWPDEMLEVLQAEYHEAVKGKPAGSLRALENKSREYPELGMIVVSDGKTLALLDDTFVQEGDFYKTWTVRTIRSNEVTLWNTRGEVKLKSNNTTEPFVLPPHDPAQEPGLSGMLDVKPDTDSGNREKKSLQVQMELIKLLYQQLEPYLPNDK